MTFAVALLCPEDSLPISHLSSGFYIASALPFAVFLSLAGGQGRGSEEGR